jgi:methionyl aminopeptidase
MPLYTNPAEIEKIKAAGRAAAEVLAGICEFVTVRFNANTKSGISAKDIDDHAAKLMKEIGCTSACLNYKSSNKKTPPYPGYICISVNDEVVHGIGTKEKIIKDGDIVSLDVVVEKDGYIGDNARTIPVGKVSPEVEKLLKVTEESLYLAIEKAVRGNRVGDISAAVQKHVEAAGFSVVRDFVGHGVGRTMHEEPQIPNYGKPGSGEELKVGTVIAIEPMINLGKREITIDADGWTARTADGKPSAHFEHTVLVTSKGPRILTQVL